MRLSIMARKSEDIMEKKSQYIQNLHNIDY